MNTYSVLFVSSGTSQFVYADGFEIKDGLIAFYTRSDYIASYPALQVVVSRVDNLGASRGETVQKKDPRGPGLS